MFIVEIIKVHYGDNLRFVFTEDSLKIKKGLELVSKPHFSYNFLIKLNTICNLNFNTRVCLLPKLFSKGWYTYDVYENCPIFKTPHPLVHLRPKFFYPLDLGHPISNESPFFLNDNQSIKRKQSKDDYCYQILPSGRLSFLASTH